MMLPLVLCSSSPARRALLKRLELPFTACSPDIDETPLPGESAFDLVARLAEQKAQAHKAKYPAHLIIGCDQVIELDGEIVGKPNDHADAVRTLTRASNNCMHSYTGMCLFNSKTGRKQTIVEPYDVYFRELSTQTIENYLQQEKPYQCAGSIKAEGLGTILFSRLQGDDPTALTGLPLIRLTSLLQNEGIAIV